MYELDRPDTCSVGRAMDVLGERWTFLILREAFYGVRRFSDMQRNLGIARNILSTRLQTLVGAGILERRRYQEEPERYEYRLTEAGLDPLPGDRRDGAVGNPKRGRRRALRCSSAIAGCGEITEPKMVSSECGEEIQAREMKPMRGPGAQ